MYTVCACVCNILARNLCNITYDIISGLCATFWAAHIADLNMSHFHCVYVIISFLQEPIKLQKTVSLSRKAFYLCVTLKILLRGWKRRLVRTKNIFFSLKKNIHMEVHSLCLCRTVSEDVVHLGSLGFRQGLGRFLAAVYSVWRRHSKSKLQHSRWLAGGCSEQEMLVRGECRRGVLQAKSSLHWKKNIDKEHTRRQRMTNTVVRFCQSRSRNPVVNGRRMFVRNIFTS